MNTVDLIAHVIAILWIVSEILLSILRRVKDKSKDYGKLNSLILWIINTLSISIGINVAANNELGGIGSIPGEHLLISYAGLLLIISGIIVRWTAIRTLRKHFTTSLTILENHKIIHIGIYKYIRHPSYTGCLLSFLGLSITFSNWITTIIMFIPILIGYLYRIKVEEKMLIEHFGAEYITYAQNTQKLIPKIY